MKIVKIEYRVKPDFAESNKQNILKVSIQFLGEKEREAIKKEYEKMLARLCQINEKWCLPISESQAGHNH